MRKTLLTLFILANLFALPAFAVAQDDEPAGPPSPPAKVESVPDTETDSARTWYNSFADATEAARKDKRQLLLVYETEWCRWCQAMNDSTWIDPTILGFAKNLVFVRIDGDLDTVMVQRYHVMRFPTAILTSDQGIEVDRFAGYFGPRGFQEELTRALEGGGTIWEMERMLKERNDPHIMVRVAREYLERGEPSRSQEFLVRAKSLDMDGSLGAAEDALFVEALIERDEKNWYKAIEVLKQLVKKYPESEWREDAELYIPWLLAQAGDGKEALKKYNEFLQNYGSSTETQWVKRQITKLEPVEAQPAAPAQPPGR